MLVSVHPENSIPGRIRFDEIMRQYVIDELRPADFHALKTYLDDRYAVEGFEGLYRVNIPRELLSDIQEQHEDCGPHYFALELLPGQLACELLVRSQERIRCDCIGYANKEQRDWIVQVVDGFFEQLSIIS